MPTYGPDGAWGSWPTQEAFNTWTDPNTVSMYGGINPTTGKVWDWGTQGAYDYINRAQTGGAAEARRQSEASGGGGLFGGLGGLGTIVSLASLAFGGPPGLGDLAGIDSAIFGAGDAALGIGVGEAAAGAGLASDAGIFGTGDASLDIGAGDPSGSGLGFNGVANNTFNFPSDAESADFGLRNSGFGNLAASAFQAPSAFTQAAQFVKALPWSTISGGMNVGSGIYGMMQKRRLDALAKQAFGNFSRMGDPYAQVKALMANPGSVSSHPGYQFGLDEGRRAIQRQGAASGGGGNEAIALARYTPEYAQNFYNNEVARLMGVAGGEAQLGTANAGLGLNAQGASNQLASSALGSIGYGATQLGGGSPYDQLIARLLNRPT